MRSRIMREGSVGLLILAGLGVFGGGVVWLKGLNPAHRSFTVTVNFPTIAGVQSGTSVRYRGVVVGRIVSITPQSAGVDVKISIAPADLLIPANVAATIDQSGLLGENVVNLMPKNQDIPQVATKPLDKGCEPNVILCDGSRLDGAMGIGTDALIESTMRFADLYSQPEFYQNLNQLTSHSGNAAKEIALMSREFRTLARELRREVRTLSPTAITVNNAASKAGITADRASVTFEQINSLLAASRGKLVASLDSIEQTSVALRLSLRQLGPTIDRFQQSQVLTDLERLSANAAATSENLKDVSQNLNNPATLASLQQTLDAARSTFQNAQKITADLDEITGDPEMRKQFKEVIKGFGNLLSSSQQLQRNAAYAQQLAPTAAQQLTQQRTAQPTPAPVAPLSPPGLAKPVALGQSQRILPPVLSSEPPVKALGTVVK